ncbi:hypothetical protein [Streptomyces resistomycificus]|uniref:Uncharacterized protein n=1 Tax=Streptomyces resistomycificus TaxID=67356 RepID=A0A0L8L6C3_9ACTN|nr:hypothetical protein [Streptomyces resistomycificus]KOG33702.1 hypothetical protein ADK37_21495 [Streptomyces resistomycificus]KUN93918.1 hypothetical protein AQJ84_28775 [Streptomyces resistomycificus]
MGRTIHEDIAEDELADMLADADQARHLHTVAARLREGHFPDWLAAMVGQTPARPGSWPSHQVAAFTSVMTRLAYGRIARHRIRVGASPGADADRVGNAASLQGLPAPFVAHLDMTQHGADCDGSLEWTEPVTAWRSTAVPVLGAHVLHGAIQAPFEVRPSSVPLEVGYTLPSRTFAHLLTEGAVARWPYDDEEVHVLVDLEWAGLFMGARPLPADVEPVRAL